MSKIETSHIIQCIYWKTRQKVIPTTINVSLAFPLSKRYTLNTKHF